MNHRKVYNSGIVELDIKTIIVITVLYYDLTTV